LDKIGDIVSIQHEENVGYWHQAHSYVRGNWRNSNESSPMILAKACHDLDMILWLVEADCKNINSFGSLIHFKEENAPEGVPQYCLDGCIEEKTCPYHAKKIYLDWKDSWQARVIRSVVSSDSSDEGVYRALKKGRYGRCVYKCDNNVVDHQTVNMEFDNGVTAVFTMSAFTNKSGRVTRIWGTKGSLIADMEEGSIRIEYFGQSDVEHIQTTINKEGHGGGDYNIMKELVSSLQKGDADALASSASVSVQSHLMAYAAEFSRLNNGLSIDLKKFKEENVSV